MPRKSRKSKAAIVIKANYQASFAIISSCKEPFSAYFANKNMLINRNRKKIK